MSSIMSAARKNKSRQVTAFAAGLGSSCLEKVVIPYTNSPSTNPVTKVASFCDSTNLYKRMIIHYSMT